MHYIMCMYRNKLDTRETAYPQSVVAHLCSKTLWHSSQTRTGLADEGKGIVF